MKLSNITLNQLRSDYKGRHGFVFEGSHPSNSPDIQKTCEVLIKYKLVEVMPELITKLDERTFVFVYPEGVSFNMPDFIQFCDYWSHRSRAFAVDTLHNLINSDINND